MKYLKFSLDGEGVPAAIPGLSVFLCAKNSIVFTVASKKILRRLRIRFFRPSFNIFYEKMDHTKKTIKAKDVKRWQLRKQPKGYMNNA